MKTCSILLMWTLRILGSSLSLALGRVFQISAVGKSGKSAWSSFDESPMSRNFLCYEHGVHNHKLHGKAAEIACRIFDSSPIEGMLLSLVHDSNICFIHVSQTPA